MAKYTTVIISSIFLSILFTISYLYISSKFVYAFAISGTVQYHKADITVSLDFPEGYYIESSALERVYIEHSNIFEFLESDIAGKGAMGKVCSNTSGLCYPNITLKEISIR